MNFVIWAIPAASWAQSTQVPPATGKESTSSNTQSNTVTAPIQDADPSTTGVINGTILDGTGSAVVGAHVKLAGTDRTPAQEVISDENGQFSIVNAAPGPFMLAINAMGFTPQTFSGVLPPGQVFEIPQITLEVASEITSVRVVLPQQELAELQLKDEEKQRVFGVIPNFYVVYDPHPAPLSSKQKFELAWRSTFDPVTFVLVGASAGIQQATDQFGGYGQGAAGYGKRYGATYGDLITGTFIGGAILPSLLKQDPRYFYKGSGTPRSRLLYALANSVICKGDNGHWQPNYSNILGSLAAGGISNLYYPPDDRNGVGLTFENALIGIGTTAAANVLQEFVIPKLTPSFANRGSSKQEGS
jgi:Carboxypeptidase regulatory-like domain